MDYKPSKDSHWTHSLYNADTGECILVNAHAITGSPTEELIALKTLQNSISHIKGLQNVN